VQQSPTSPAANVRDRLLVLGFLTALAAPWADTFVRSDEQRGPLNREFRSPAARPVLALDAHALHSFPSAYEAYFQDSFGLRDVLLRWHSLQALGLFGVSPTDQVLLGKQGWYFFTGNRSAETWRGLFPFTEDELEQWKLGLEARRDWLRARGIEYLFVIAPNKETIYPDYMPERLEPLGPTRLEQFAQYMAQHSDLRWLDLREPLRAARAQDRPGDYVYLQEGSHWNGRGSLCALQAILARAAQLVPGIVPPAPDTWQLVPYGQPGDTWARRMYIGDLSAQQEFGLALAQGKPRSRQLNRGREGEFGPGRKLLLGTEDPAQPRAMLLHDSFGPYIESALSEHFSQLDCEWTYEFDPIAVADAKPNLVIELWVERALVFLDPRALPPQIGVPAEVEFAAAPNVCLKLDPAGPLTAKPLGRLELEPMRDERGPALRIQTRAGGDSLLLPALSCGSKGKLLVNLSIDSPARGVLDVFYLLEGETDYSRQHNCLVPLEQGRNELHFRMPLPGVTGRLRLRPAYSALGPYLLRSFEVRSGVGP